MATGFKSKIPDEMGGGMCDLDDLFEPIGTSSPRPPTKFHVHNQDLANRFMASVGDDQIAFDTGFKAEGGVDLRYLFRRKGYTEPA